MKLLLVLSFALSGSAAWACHGEHGKKMSPMSKEDRAKMAAAHEGVATCLKSERPDQECMEEMHKAHAGMHSGKKSDKKKE